MKLSYRTRKRLRNVGITVLILFLVGLVVWMCWAVWVERYVVYTRDGAHLDFSLSSGEIEGVSAVAPSVEETIGVYYNEGEGKITPDTSLTRLAGYYADAQALSEDMEAVSAKIMALPSGAAVMLDVKSIYGNFYYSSKVDGAVTSDSVDIAAMDKLISGLKDKGLYTIARLPAFRDRSFGLEHVSSGLPTEAGYLWSDENSCYWLNPEDSGTMMYLVSIVSELKKLGFDEVVFSEFRFPTTDQIVYEGNKTEALTKAAQDLVTACATEAFAVSFQTTDTGFPVPQGRTRLYLTGVEAGNAAATAAKTKVEDKSVNLVYLAESNDTRYDAYGVLRPLDSANAGAPTGTTGVVTPTDAADPTETTGPEDTTSPNAEG